MSRGLPLVVVVCLIVVGIAIKATAAHYGNTHPVVVILALTGLIIGAVCVAYLVTWLRRLLRSGDRSVTPS
jgi:drug/metabolite transporter (DMT)-like permease